jgi:hypothetical protein
MRIALFIPAMILLSSESVGLEKAFLIEPAASGQVKNCRLSHSSNPTFTDVYQIKIHESIVKNH